MARAYFVIILKKLRILGDLEKTVSMATELRFMTASNMSVNGIWGLNTVKGDIRIQMGGQTKVYGKMVNSDMPENSYFCTR